jgi:radical SAM superfamily enzyme YgiQ (UPF0313 family)
MQVLSMNVLLLYADKYYLIKQVYPFGLDLIANYLRQYGHRVTLDYPFLPDKDVETNFAKTLEETDPDVVGIGIRNLDTCMSCEAYGDFQGHDCKTFYFLPAIKEIVDMLKRRRPKLPVIVGGGAFTISPVAILKYLGLEYGIVGEGEEPFRQFLEAFPDKGKISRIPNMVHFKGKFVVNNRQAYRFSRGQHVKERERKFNYAYETVGLPVQVKRGCNQTCSYCVEPLIEGRKFVFRPMEAVVDELKAVLADQRDIRTIFFVDTEFNVPDQQYPMTLAEKIIGEGLHEYFHFSIQALPRPFDADFAKILSEAGFSLILTSDSFADGVLKENQASYRQEDVVRTLELCEEHGIDCTVAMIFGLPGETYETIDHSIGLMDKYPSGFLRRYEYTIGGRIYQGTPLCRFIETVGGEKNLYGKRSEGFVEPSYFCTPESPMKLKEYIQGALPHPMMYQNSYDETRFGTLALSYLIDQRRWEEATSLFNRNTLRVRSSIYDYFFRKSTDAGRTAVAEAVSVNLLEGIQGSDEIKEYGEQAELIRYYLSLLR